MLRPENVPAEHARQDLPTEADAQDGHLGFLGLGEEVHLVLDPFDVVLVGAELGAEGDDELVGAGVEVVWVLLVDPESLDFVAALAEPGSDQAGRRGLLVLDDERASAHARPPMGADSSLPSTSLQTPRRTPAKRSTISASSSSDAVNAGAKSVWSPA